MARDAHFCPIIITITVVITVMIVTIVQVIFSILSILKKMCLLGVNADRELSVCY